MYIPPSASFEMSSAMGRTCVASESIFERRRIWRGRGALQRRPSNTWDKSSRSSAGSKWVEVRLGFLASTSRFSRRKGHLRVLPPKGRLQGFLEDPLRWPPTLRFSHVFTYIMVFLRALRVFWANNDWLFIRVISDAFSWFSSGRPSFLTVPAASRNSR